jgi:hypothetical protein
MKAWLRWSAWLCLSLMFWTVAVESTHQHPNQTDASSCSICLVAHATRPSISSSHTSPTFIAVGLLQEEAIIAKARFDFSDAGIRGPPAL